MKVVIIGGGIGGLAAAACLLKQGHHVRVYEQAPELGEIGAAVQMSANAVKVLDHLGLREYMESVAVKPKAFEFRRYDDGEILHTIPLGDSHEAQHGAPYYQVHRVDLHVGLLRVVLSLDKDAVRLGCRAVEISESETGVNIKFEDGSATQAELLIGADGIKSVVRKYVIDTEPPKFTGQVAWRISIPTERIPQELRPDVVSSIWCGPKNHAVMYYMRSGTLLNFVGCVERPWEEESWTTKKPWTELDEDYRGWHPIVRAVIDNVDHDQCYRWALNNREPVLEWSTKRITLLGDAVHPTLPYMAQGAAMAIEDAAVLSRVLALDVELPDALKTYQELRAPRTARVVRESTEMADLYHISNKEEMRQAFKNRNLSESRNGWLYPYDPMNVTLVK